MNNAENFPVDVEEQRDWINAEKASKGLSWAALGSLAGIPGGTLSGFGGGSYAGNKERVAREVFKYRQLVESQAERAIGLVDRPDYFETETSRRLRGLLTIAHSGRITVAATGPGTGKTVTVREYAASVANCWVATMKPTTKTVNAMMSEVLRAIGSTTRAGYGSQLSRLIYESICFKRGLLVIDEANYLSLDALEEIRSWHDEVGGPGVALLGNEELLQRIENASKRDAYGRLNSRIASRHIQNLPVAVDVAAFCDAYQLDDAGMRALLTRIALTPGAGGLRECRQIVEQASLLAADDERPLALSDLRDAQSTRATRSIL